MQTIRVVHGHDYATLNLYCVALTVGQLLKSDRLCSHYRVIPCGKRLATLLVYDCELPEMILKMRMKEYFSFVDFIGTE